MSIVNWDQCYFKSVAYVSTISVSVRIIVHLEYSDYDNFCNVENFCNV